jgi:plastocyanin
MALDTEPIADLASRRKFLVALGATSVTGLAGCSGDGDGGPMDGQDGDDGGGDGRHFVSDLIDPTFGYPLATDETDDVDIAHVVEAYTEEGEGAHEGFPQFPEEGNPPQVEFAFDPVGIHVEQDALIHFFSSAGEHTVTAIHEKFSMPMRPVPTRVPDGVLGFTSPPIVDGESWVYQFPERGVYDILCLPHYFLGMVMRVVVGDPDEGEAFEAPTAGKEQIPPNVQAVLSADELDPANIVDAGTIAWEDLTLEMPEPPQDGEEPGDGDGDGDGDGEADI